MEQYNERKSWSGIDKNRTARTQVGTIHRSPRTDPRIRPVIILIINNNKHKESKFETVIASKIDTECNLEASEVCDKRNR